MLSHNSLNEIKLVAGKNFNRYLTIMLNFGVAVPCCANGYAGAAAHGVN
ncbi:hypothetical protein BN2497_4841 [Janthinobacterium sp. CG23_2]|nr:hypothetical protein BN2497_4841 [Janthinobacterium sp. CG23_2]CUU28818.1 hypothetical protein BN3177_4841 [Janthinobacterium sp. CG23_2]